MRKRKVVMMPCEAPPGSQLFDQLGRIVGQALSCEQRADGKWQIEMDVDQDADVDRLQVMPLSGITGSING
jgi:hypothetical protein